MSYLHFSNETQGYLDVESNAKKGLEIADQYKAASPFPHISIDNFLPASIANKFADEFPTQFDPDSSIFNRDQERLKVSYNPDYVSSELRAFFYCFNTRPFVIFLQNVTGIEGLIPDPYFVGGGFHEIRQGGHLSVHADFNHHKLLDVERRVNVLIYLNRDWKEEYGGQLELWNNEMTRCEKSYVPIFNRCVIFNTTSTSNHGNPQPINHPRNVPRRSIALYYYTSTWTSEKRDHTTQFRVRPGTGDRPDISVRLEETLRDFLPPIVHRNLLRVARRLRAS
jgi:hypothetical protein